MKPSAPETNPVRTTLLLGVATIVAQSVLLREAMAAMGGSETAWGLVMALWLAGMGAGSRLGVRFGSARAAAGIPVAVLVLAGAGVVLFRAAPAMLGAAPGETTTTWTAVWLWAAAVAPAAVAGGIAFPAVAQSLGTRGPGRAYLLEACGALGAGLVLTFALMHLGTAGALLTAAGFVAATSLWPRSRVTASAVMLVLFLLVAPAGEHLADASWTWSRHPGKLGAWAETRHQRLEISAGPPFNLYTDGRLRSTYPDIHLTHPRAHVMMLLHPAPRRVLAIGGISDGSAEAMILHHPAELVLIEEDPKLPVLVRNWFGDAFRSNLDLPAVRLRPNDPVRVIGGESDLDLILLTDRDPTTLRANRTRTLEFFHQCRRAMKADGVLVLDVGVSDTYLGGDGGRLLATLAATLKTVFATIDAIPGERVLIVAAGAGADLDTSPGALTARLRRRPDVARHVLPGHLEYLLEPARRPALRDFLATENADLNTVRHPIAVGLAARHHEARTPSMASSLIRKAEIRGPAILSSVLGVAATALLIATILGRVSLRASVSAWVVGVASMGWWLLLLTAWQGARGSVFTEVGALTAAFMAGVAGGGWVGIRRPRPERDVPWLLAAGAVVSLAIAVGLPSRWPLLAVPGFLLLGGWLTGAAFPGLGALAGGGSARRGAGIAFAADEIGAASAALIIGTVAIPWVGMTATATGLAVLGAAAIPAALRR